MTELLIRNGKLLDGRVVDVRIRDGRVAEVGVGLRSTGDELPADGGALLPGLHDHHLHLHAAAAAMSSVRCGPPSVSSIEELAAALQTAATRGPVRAVGYHESVAGLLDRELLDRLVPGQPVRVQHRSGAAWFLNSRAIDAAELDTTSDAAIERHDDGRPTGRVWRGDHLLRTTTSTFPELQPLGRRLARFGVTGLTDATPDLSPPAVTALRNAPLPQRVLLLGAPLGDADDDVGPWKVLLDESDLDLDGLESIIRTCRDIDRAVAIHAVTRAETVVAVTALRRAGAAPGSRLEHGSVLPPDLDTELRSLGVTVVTQPHFAEERGDDYLRDVDPSDVPYLYRCASLVAAGVPLAAGTDAPYGDLDPWRAVAAATSRTTRSGRVLGESERLDPRRALGLFLGTPQRPGRPSRTIEPGADADLCLLDAPLDVVLREPSVERVRATVIAGGVAYNRG
jgi:predicted amidohydrolase YtcJ